MKTTEWTETEIGGIRPIYDEAANSFRQLAEESARRMQQQIEERKNPKQPQGRKVVTHG